MSTNAQDFDFDEYDKPGTERSRRRRGDDDTLQSDLEEDLLEEDWLSGKKNPSEVSDEELNDDLLQSDDEDLSMMGPDVSLGMDTSYDQQDNSQEAAYTDDIVNLGTEGCEDEEEEGYHQEDEEAYAGELRQEDDIEMSEDQIEYSGVHAEDDDGYQDEVLDIQITEPIDGEFQDEDYQTYGDEALNEEEAPQGEDVEEVGREELQDEEDIAEKSRICEPEEGENDTLAEEKKEESDEEEDEGEESGRIRFKSERTEGAVVRLADAGQRRNIPETLELSEKAKKDLMEFEEQERQKRQNRYGGRGRGGARGGRGRGGFSGYGMTDFRGGQRRKMHDQMLPLMGNRNIQPQLRMLPLHQQLQSHQHHPSRPRGPPPPPQFSEHGRPIPQQSLQPLIPPHMAHRSPPLRPQMEQSPRMMNSPPLNFPQHHHQQQPPQPKNIHINPHFRGPVQSSVQVPLMPPAQSQSRPAVVPQRFPALGDFQQHMPGNFGQPQRPPHHMEPLRNQPPQGPQDREPLLMGECPDSTRFPAQHMFDHQGPGPLMNSSNNLHQQQLPGQGHMGFGPPGLPFNQPGQGSIGLFQREPPRPNLPPHQGHQGMLNLNQQGGPPNQPRPFMSPRQPFGQQGNPFPPPQVQFGMQGLMHGPPVSHLPHHDPMSPHPIHQHQQQQHHHRQELSHQQQINLSESRPMTHHGQSPFHQQHGSPRQMTPRPQNPQQRNMSNRQRMNTPISKQMPQRNSNLRELPVAPGNTNMHSSRPAPTLAFPAANIKPVARATPGTRPGLSAQSTSGGGRGRGQVAKTESQPGGAGDRTMVNKESPSTPTSTAPQDPNEDEETRQYRLKIEEQKRLREEILRKKELRRQMQADVRKKELLKRLNAHTPNQGPTPTQTQPVPSNEQQQHPVQQQQPQQTLQQQQKQPLIQAQQQRQIPRRTQQTLNHTLQNPNQGSTLPPGGAPQTPTPYPNVRIGPQTVKGSTQEHHTPSAGPEQQWRQPQQNQQQLQQRRNSSTQDINRPNAPAQHAQVPQKNTQVAQGLVQTQGPKPGAKRTVMQRLKNPGTESQQVPQKVRVVKLSGMSGKGPEATSEPTQQQSSWQASPLNQSIQRKVTMMGQQQLGPGGTPQASRGGRGNAQQSRVVVSSQGRGRGESQMGRGQPVSTRQNQRAAEDSRCTVSIEGLSTSTSEYQLKNLLRSIGPIEMFKMMPQQRKAVATFSNPEHAANFQMSFHRHMIDLSHIDVSLIDG